VRRRLLILCLLLASTLLAAIALYALSLDREIRQRFTGARWALPAQVYAAPMDLYPGLPMNAETLAAELDRLGYRRLQTMAGPGTYSLDARQINLVTRAFEFWDGAQPARRLAIRFDSQGVSEIIEPGVTSMHALLRLDPMVIGSIYASHGEDRVLVRLDEVPQILAAGIVLVEDRHFFRHFGISIRGISRAAVANLRAGRVVQGGSTITQQLVRNFFLTLDQTWRRKLNEALMSVLIEVHYEKAEILEAYLNEIFLGQDGDRAVHGFGLASRHYFNKPIEELATHEIALLVGLAKGASFYNPRRNPERAKGRRDLVLRIFHDAGLIDADELAAAIEKPLGVGERGQGGTERYPAFVDLVRRQLQQDYKEQDLLNDGLRIFTTLDPRSQDALEREIGQQLPALEKARNMAADTLEAAGLIISAEGGEVQALVGGRRTRFAGFNRALDARRPIGSLSKPFVYLTALNAPDRFNLFTYLRDVPVSLSMPNGSTWTPTNFDEKIYGDVRLYEALARSYNLATVNLGLDVGIEPITRTMAAAGLRQPPRALPSLTLGALDLSPFDVAQMYSTLATGGYRYPLTAIREVTTVDGEPLSRYGMRVSRALPEGPTYLTNWAMEQVMIFGTGRAAYNALSPMVRLAGKTGTTDGFRDAWFAGFSSDRVGVIWVGRDDNQPTGLSGSSGALPIWARTFARLNARSFDPLMPPDVEMVLTDPETGLRADDNCLNPMEIPYIVGYSPTEMAPCATPAVPQGRGLTDWFRGLWQ
jgi:penicillin-binding protein 1B